MRAKLAPRSEGPRRMAEAAAAAGVQTQVGFNYLCNPMLACAREMIRSGELGDITGYRGLHCEDYMADAASPFTFRHDPEGGGALVDLGSHALATAEFLLGPDPSAGLQRSQGDRGGRVCSRDRRRDPGAVWF
jgi:predicted dehydrogenase